MKNLTNGERELIIRINGDEPDVVEIDVTIPKFRRQLERWGFKPIAIDAWGGATFRLSTKDVKPLSKRKKHNTMTEAQRKKAGDRLAKARKPKKTASNELTEQPAQFFKY